MFPRVSSCYWSVISSLVVFDVSLWVPNGFIWFSYGFLVFLWFLFAFIYFPMLLVALRFRIIIFNVFLWFSYLFLSDFPLFPVRLLSYATAGAASKCRGLGAQLPRRKGLAAQLPWRKESSGRIPLGCSEVWVVAAPHGNASL